MQPTRTSRRTTEMRYYRLSSERACTWQIEYVRPIGRANAVAERRSSSRTDALHAKKRSVLFSIFDAKQHGARTHIICSVRGVGACFDTTVNQQHAKRPTEFAHKHAYVNTHTHNSKQHLYNDGTFCAY